MGIDLEGIRKSLNKEKLKSLDTHEISENIDMVSKRLEESRKIIDVALLEMGE